MPNDQKIELKPIHQHEVQKGRNGEFVLYRDKQPVRCPFIPPVMMPGKIQGQMDLQYTGCSTLCAKAEVLEAKEGDERWYEYHQGCAMSRVYEIYNLSDKPPKQDGGESFDKGAVIRQLGK